MSNDSTKALLKQLKDPFDPKFIKWRVGATNSEKTKGIALAYLDAREVKKRLDDVMGITKWKDELIRVEKGGFICNLYLKIEDEWIPRSNAGEDSNMAAIKGGASDAFKRAASKWGIGHYLYYLPNVWVPIVKQGNSYVLAQTPELPPWAKPNPDLEDWETIAELEAEANNAEEDETIDPELFEAYGKIIAIKKVGELEKYVKSLSMDYQISLQAIVSKKTEELLANESDSSTNQA